MYRTYPKRYKLTLAFLQATISKEDKILDLGVENPFSEIMKRAGLSCDQYQGEDLDVDTHAVQTDDYDVVTAFEIFEHLVSPYNVIADIQAKNWSLRSR